MYFRFDIVEIMNQVLFVGNAFEESRFVVARERLPARGPGIPMDKAEVACQNAVDERDIAADNGVLDFLLERENLGRRVRLLCSGSAWLADPSPGTPPQL